MRKILLYLDCVRSNFQSRAALQLELIVLRHQLEVVQRARVPDKISPDFGIDRVMASNDPPRSLRF